MTDRQRIKQLLESLPEGEHLHPDEIADQIGCHRTYVYRIASAERFFHKLGSRKLPANCRVKVRAYRYKERIVQIPSSLVKLLGESVTQVNVHFDGKNIIVSAA